MSYVYQQETSILYIKQKNEGFESLSYALDVFYSYYIIMNPPLCGHIWKDTHKDWTGGYDIFLCRIGTSWA